MPAHAVTTPVGCPICERAGHASLYCRKDEAAYYRCRSCGLIFQYPLPARSSMITWANEEYTSGAYRDYVDARPMKIRHFEDRLADIGNRLRPGRLLDIGCSCGYFMEVAASRGFDVQGVEFSRSRHCGSGPNLRSRIFEGTLERCPSTACSTSSARSTSSSTCTIPRRSCDNVPVAEARGRPRHQHA